jgi:GTP cyclohydrolase I
MQPDIVAAEQILIASLLANPNKLFRKEKTFIFSELPIEEGFEYQQWKSRYLRVWDGHATFARGINFVVPPEVCVKLRCKRILEGKTAHLLSQLNDFGLAVWFMEAGSVLDSYQQIFLRLPNDWEDAKQTVERLSDRFDASIFQYFGTNLCINGTELFKDTVFPFIVPTKRSKFRHLHDGMHDVSTSATSSVGIQKVGIRQVPIPLNIHLRSGVQPTIAKASIYTSLSPSLMGSHLSRLMEVLNTVSGRALKTDLETMQEYLETMKDKLSAEDAFLKLRFPILLSQKAPVSGIESKIRYECTLEGSLVSGLLKVYKKIKVPYLSACVCSKSISLFNAHCQRSFADVSLLLRDVDISFEEAIEIVESSCSAPIRALLKREDEKYITESAYDNAGFVETISRSIAEKLDCLPTNGWSICCEHEESLHQHNAVSIIRGGSEFVW